MLENDKCHLMNGVLCGQLTSALLPSDTTAAESGLYSALDPARTCVRGEKSVLTRFAIIYARTALERPTSAAVTKLLHIYNYKSITETH